MSELPSIHDLEPVEHGGTVARIGFGFQDHVAAKLCLEMLQDTTMLSVHCETHDDVVLLWRSMAGEVVEFVQVKGEAPGQLWSLDRLTSREKTKVGTSLLEKSLARAACREPVLFRLVTFRDVNDALESLTLTRGHAARQPGNPKFDSMMKAVEERLPNCQCGKNLAARDWVLSALWEVTDAEKLEMANLLTLDEVFEAHGVTVFRETRSKIYQELLFFVTEAAKADWRKDQDRKIITRERMEVWVREAPNPYRGATNREVLKSKLAAAGVAHEFEDATELQRRYLLELRQPTYLDIETREIATEAVRGRLHALRTQLFVGEIGDSGPEFHNRCVKVACDVANLQALQPAPPTTGFLLGCMYEITSRCQHRFTKPTP